MPADLSATLVAAGSAALFLGTLSQGSVGFGLALLSMPILVILVPTETAVPVVMLYGTVVNFAILWQCRRRVHLGRIWPLVAAGLLGLPVGVLALERLDVRAAQLLVGAVVTAAAVAMLAGVRRKVRRERRAMVPVGLASGFLNATTAASGPPVVLFLANQAAPRMVFRANLAAYFTALNVVNLALFAARGILTAEVGRLALVWAPAAAVGAAAGLAASRHLREQLFRWIVLGLTVLAGLVAIATGLGLFDALGDGT